MARAYLFDPSTHTVRERFWVAHGEGSGWASVDVVSNTPGTHASSAGAFETGQVYEGRHGLSLRLLGLEPGINDEAYARSIVLHGAPYASPWSIATNLGRLGRSEGCLVLDPEVIDGVVEELGTGSLVYVHASLDARAPRPTTLDRPFSARAR